jgi:hypothetical protein
MAETTLTVAQLVAEYRYRLGDPTASYWSNAYLERAVRDGAREYGATGPLSWQQQTLDVVGGTPTYALSANLREVDRVYYDGQRIPSLTPDEMKPYGSELGEVETGLVRGYMLDYIDAPGAAGPVGNAIRLVRAPGASKVGALVVWYFGTIIGTVTDKLPIPDAYVHPLWWYVARRAYLREGETQNIRLATVYERLIAGVKGMLMRREALPSQERTIVLGGHERSHGLPIAPPTLSDGRILGMRRYGRGY